MRKELYEAFEAMGPDEEQRERMRANIRAAADKKRSRGTGIVRRVAVLAAVVALFAAFGVTAYANGWFGLGSASIGEQTIDMGFGETATVEMIAPSYDGSPEYAAVQEYEDFLAGYDTDHAILQSIGNSPTEFDEKYFYYSCYTQEMADKIDEVCEKYNLRLLQGFNLPESDAEFFSLAGTGAFFTRSSESALNRAYDPYVTDDGTFHLEGDLTLLGEGRYPYPISYQFVRCVKGYFCPWVLNIGDGGNYTEWSYTTHDGVEVTLALGNEKALILADRPDSYLQINILNPYAGDVVYGEVHMNQADVEAFADAFDLSQIPGSAVAEITTSIADAEDPGWKECYRSVLEDWHVVEPIAEGSFAYWRSYFAYEEDLIDFDRYAVLDLNRDGTPELLLRSQGMGLTIVLTYDQGLKYLGDNDFYGILPETGELIVHGHWHGAGGSFDNEWSVWDLFRDPDDMYSAYFDYLEFEEGRNYSFYSREDGEWLSGLQGEDAAARYDAAFRRYVESCVLFDQLPFYPLTDPTGLESPAVLP